MKLTSSMTMVELNCIRNLGQRPQTQKTMGKSEA